jgi:hypothetical protein
VHSLKYAFRFIWASFSLAFEKVQLQEQWLHIAIGNLALLLIWFLPLGLTVGLIGIRPVGMIFIGLVSIFMLFSFYLWGEITIEYASKMLADFSREKPVSESEETPKQSLFEHWNNILIWSLIKPVLGLQFNSGRLFWPERAEKYPWFESHALVIPIISLENLNLKETVSRIEEMIAGHLLRFKPGFVKVDLVARVVCWVMGFIGIMIGLSVAIFVADPLSADPWQRILVLGIGLLIAWFFLTLGHIFSAFTRSCFHTALYQWVMNVKAARESGDPAKAVPPDILRQSME